MTTKVVNYNKDYVNLFNFLFPFLIYLQNIVNN